MKKQYIAYIIPGFRENENPVNKRIQKLFEARNIKCKICNIHWKHRVMSDYVAEFLEFYRTNSPGDKKVILFGFSFGAFANILVSTKIQVHTKILCSVSPYWKEDLPTTPIGWKHHSGVNRISDFEQLSCENIIQQSIGETYVLVGGNEHDACLKRSIDISKLLNIKCRIIPDAPHDIANPNYFREIESTIKNLSLNS